MYMYQLYIYIVLSYVGGKKRIYLSLQEVKRGVEL